MEYGTIIAPTTVTPDFSDSSVTAFDNTAGVFVNEIRRYNYHDYRALANIYPLATYSWNDPNVGITPEVIQLADGTSITATSVPCVKDTTVVYVVDTHLDMATPPDAIGQYFLFTGTSGNIDFTTINPASPANFTKVINYRHVDVYPDTAPLYWEDLGAVNSRLLLNGVVSEPTVSPVSASMTYVFNIDSSSNAFLLLGMLNCSSIDVLVEGYSYITSAYTTTLLNTSIALKNLDGVYDSWTWHFTPISSAKDRFLVRYPVTSKCKITITFNGTFPSIGEILFTRLINIGQTLDKPTGRRKTFNQTQVDASGKRTVTRYNTIKDEVTYKIAVPLNAVDNIIRVMSTLLDESLVIIGDETGTYTALLHYGYISDLPYEIATSDTENKYSLTVNTLI